MTADMIFNLLPVTFIVPYLVTGTADRQQAAQFFDLSKGLFQFMNDDFLIFVLFIYLIERKP